ncbi:cspA [Symbiodinium natans]|uniref:CspA protein n=1 Tax=Symbiodinium natans TaxID=878477 RepID=A0A812UII9_9DINO|nr:cspA [Symbiodinium natans]
MGTFFQGADAPGPPPLCHPPPLVELSPEHYSDLLTGQVKCWFEDRGFGFITPEGGAEDVFVHKSVLKDGQSLIVDSSVMFDLTYDPDRRRFQATRCFGATLPPDEVSQSRVPRKGPFCLTDPWEALYSTCGAEHLRINPHGLVSVPKAAASVKPASETAASRAEDAVDAELPAAPKEKAKKESKATSIYDFFQDDEQML